MKRNSIRRLAGPAIVSALGIIVFRLIYIHLAKQAVSQGHVLQELDPLMGAVTAVGAKLYQLGGVPAFTPMVIAVTVASASIVFFLASRDANKDIAPLRLLAAVALSFFIMCVCGTIGGSALYLFGILVVPVLGFLGFATPDAGAEDCHKAGRGEKALIAGIVLLGLIIRLYKLDVFPRVCTFDERYFADQALHLFGGDDGFFVQTTWVRTHLIKLLYLRAGFSALGIGMFQARTTSILEGALCILLIYLLCRKM